MFTKSLKPPKKTLDDLLSSKEIITGKEVIHNLNEQEKRQKEFEETDRKMKRVLYFLILICGTTNIFSQSLQSEYLGGKDVTQSINLYTSSEILRKKTVYKCGNESRIIFKVISFASDAVTTKEFFVGVTNNESPLVTSYSKNGDVITWKGCIGPSCNLGSNQYEFFEKTKLLYEKSTLSDTSVINKYKCEEIKNINSSNSSIKSENEQKTELILKTLNNNCNKGINKGCLYLGALYLQGFLEDEGKRFISVEVNEKLSNSFLIKGCEMGDGDACQFYAVYNFKKKLNTQETLDFMRRGCQLGSKESCDSLKRISQNNRP
jgi:hypothetical protein